MVGRRMALKALIPPLIAVLFVLPLTALRREPRPAEEQDLAATASYVPIIEDAALFADWQPAPLQTYWPDAEVGPGRPALSDKINGGDAFVYEHGFERLWTRELRDAGGNPAFYLEEYRMADAQGAWGLWSANRGRSDVPLEVGALAAGTEDRVVLCRGPRYLTVSADYDADLERLGELAGALGGALAAREPDGGAPAFPLQDVPRITQGEVLLLGPLGAQTCPLPAELLGISREQPGWSFAVPAGDSHVPAVLVSWSEPRWAQLAAHLGVAGNTTELRAGAPDDRICARRRGDWIAIGYLIASDAELDTFRKAIGS